MNHDLLALIKDRLALSTLMLNAGVELKKSGGTWKACCPFHAEKTPSFSVDDAKQFYYCFGCGASGDVFQFVQDFQKMSFSEAVSYCASLAGVSDDPVNKESQQQAAAEAKRRQEEFAKAAEELKLSENAEVAKKSKALFAKLHAATNKNAYLKRKKVHAYGVKQCRDALVVPVFSFEGELVNLQFIQPDGTKKFRTKGRTKECLYWLKQPTGVEGELIFAAEGYATAASIAEAMKHEANYAVYCAFNAHNLLAAATFVYNQFPKADQVICGDHDPKPDGTNIGKELAVKAARAGDGVWVVARDPKSLTHKRKVDFNDVLVECGAEEVRSQLMVALVDLHDRAIAAEYSQPNAEFLHYPPEFYEQGNYVEAVNVLVPEAEKVSYTLNGVLNRFALIQGKTSVFDQQTREEVKQTAFKQLVGADLFNIWLKHPERREISKDILNIINEGKSNHIKNIERFVYLWPSKEVWDSKDCQVVPIDNLKILLSDQYKYWEKSEQRKILPRENLIFDPSMSVRGENYINTYTGLPLTPSDTTENCKGIRALLSHLCNNEPKVVQWVTKWLALPLQKPGAKMQSALLIHGNVQGAGKSYLFSEIHSVIYGDNYFALADQHQLESQYTDWRSQKMFCVFEEILSSSTKYNHMGTVKHMITGKTFRVDKKFLSGWAENNYMNTVFLSNESQPLPVEANDRRMMVIWPQEQLPNEILEAVKTDLKNDGIRSWYRYLLNVELGEFNEHSKPLFTDAKRRIIDYGLSSYETFFAEWSGGELPFSFVSCRTSDLYKVYEWYCRQTGDKNVFPLKKLIQLLTVFDGVKYKNRARLKRPDGGRRQYSCFAIGNPDLDESYEEFLFAGADKFRREVEDFFECDTRFF